MLLLLIGAYTMTSMVVSPEWALLQNVDTTTDTYHAHGPDPWLVSAPLAEPIPRENRFLLIDVSCTAPMRFEVRWANGDEDYATERTAWCQIEPSETPVTYCFNLDKHRAFEGLTHFRLDPGDGVSVDFTLHSMRFVTLDELDPETVQKLVEFRCYTSKLHYAPGELIEYRASLVARNYPSKVSSKILTVEVVDSSSRVVASKVQHFGLQPAFSMREIQGVLPLEEPLPPGGYTLRATFEDQMTGTMLQSEHAFGIQSDSDPFVCETPFKYVKDFSFVEGPDGLWHVFSITGDFYDTHEWMPDGQESTFSHGTSPDFRTWTWHRPVLSINQKKYPDGNGTYQDKGVWAPHVIHHDGTYYMFYTSVNSLVSQSISLATSKDLFEWQEHPANPVFTLEGVDWSVWRRDARADLRDPAVLHENGRFYLYATTRARQGERTSGAIVVAESEDLVHWSNPRVAVYTRPVPESPQVWKANDRFYMFSSAGGGGTWSSGQPDTGWVADPFPRPPVEKWENYVTMSPSYAEEVVQCEDGTHLIGSVTFRFWGNSLYFSRIEADPQGRPESYTCPFDLK